MQGLPLLLVLAVGPLFVMGLHPDCNRHQVIHNFDRICKIYPNIKRSTPDLNQVQGGYWNRDIGYNRALGRPPYPDTPGRPPYSDTPRRRQQYPETLAWGMYPEAPQGRTLHPAETPNWGMYPDPTAVQGDEEYPLEWLFNPLDYGGENQLPLERWRRGKHIREEIGRFIKDKCCDTGCSFPDDYTELDRRLNLCKLR